MANPEAVAKTKELLGVNCCSELKEAAEKWLAADGTDAEGKVTEEYIAELKADICSIDDTIGFFSSERAAAMFGAERAAQMLAHAKDVKAAGGKYCDCPACSKGLEILTILENK